MFLVPHFFISLIIPLLGFSLFIYLLRTHREPHLTIKFHQSSFGNHHKTFNDLISIGIINNFGEDFIIKTNKIKVS